jgi:DNA-binding transcriptional LysR family regulator
MKLSQIQALVAVAARKNFSEAALDLNLSQPAISHAIATLEEELGVPLFARGRRGAVLTPAGDRMRSKIF